MAAQKTAAKTSPITKLEEKLPLPFEQDNELFDENGSVKSNISFKSTDKEPGGPFKNCRDLENVRNFAQLMPASRRAKSHFELRDNKIYYNMDVIERAEASIELLEHELSVNQLNSIHDFLWMAGRPMPPRRLTYQLAASRCITAIEDVKLHLVWEPGRMFLKPLPRYLLNSAFWTKYLVCEESRVDCTQGGSVRPVSQPEDLGKRRELYGCAYGFLLSYTALIQYESDFRIAIDHHLIPEGIKWESWRQLSWELLKDSPHNNTRVNKRYHFGELRLGRLNKIARCCSLLGLTGGSGSKGLMRGFKFEFATYGQQLEAFLAPIVTATAYILLVLTAMQVGLSTNVLKDNSAFQQASWGFTVFSILAPLILVAIGFLGVFLYFIYNYQVTKTFKRKRMAFYHNLGHDDG